MSNQEVINLVSDDAWMMYVLRLIKSITLPKCCVCAGFVRSKVWDYLHEFAHSTPLTDIDVVYFDASDTEEAREKEYETVLKELDASIPWSVKNQARMHFKNGHEPYVSTADGLSNFPEVCTAIGVYLDSNDNVRLVAPYGVEDLVNLIVRPSPFYQSKDKIGIYKQRMATKKWQLTWNRLTILHG